MVSPNRHMPVSFYRRIRFRATDGRYASIGFGGAGRGEIDGFGLGLVVEASIALIAGLETIGIIGFG
jgi:hypothetical protein